MKKDKDSFEKEIVSRFISITLQMLWHYTPFEIYEIIDRCIGKTSEEQEKQNYYQEESLQYQQQQEKNKSYSFINRARKHIDAKLKITEIAATYGLDIHKNKSICPFHSDGDPSLSFSNEKNVFFCFGCHAKGDIIEFVRRMESINEKRRSN